MQVENVTVECKECGRTFRSTSDRKRLKCLAERAKPVKEERGALQYSARNGSVAWGGGGTNCAQVQRTTNQTPAKDKDSALLAPSSLRRAT